jgi:hypothetical protein
VKAKSECPDVPAELASDTLLRQGDLLDAYATDDGTVVLVGAVTGHRVVRLSPLGLAVREAIGTGATLAELEVEMRLRLGEPTTGDLSQLVRSAVLALMHERVIVAGQVPKDDNSGDFAP